MGDILNCTNGHANAAGVKFCVSCGELLAVETEAEAWISRPTFEAHSPSPLSPTDGIPRLLSDALLPQSGFASSGALVSFIGIFPVNPIVSLLGIALSVFGLTQANRGENPSKGIAIAGIVLGSIGVLFALIR